MLYKIKHQYIPVAKSLIILGLAVLAVFLTTRLWFVHIPNHSFVPYVRARFAPTIADEVAGLVRPFRVIQGSGDGYFAIRYYDIANAPQWRYGRAVITHALESHSFVGSAETDMARFLDAPVLIFEYAFYMDSAIFAQALGHRTGAVLTDRGLTNFHAIAVSPPYAGQTVLNLFFIGKTYTWEFAITVQPGNFAFDIQSARAEPHHFVMVDGLFESRLTRHLPHHPVRVTNPYHNHAGHLNLGHIRSEIAHFFANPATINQGVSARNVYTFSNMSTAVRYLPWDVIEYTSFRTVGRTSTRFVTDFSAAYAFVAADPNMRNSFFLAAYDETPLERIFWFGYTAGNFPLVLAEPWYTGPECDNPLIYPIEVTVADGRVIRYRKIAHNFELDTQAAALFHVPDLGSGELGYIIGRRSLLRPHISLQTIR